MTRSPAGHTYAGPFRVTASDGNDYFVKSLETCPPGQEMSLAIERVVAEAGELIGAPVCQSSLIRIPPEVAGWDPGRGSALKEGLAHASRALEHAIDGPMRPALEARSLDDNARRHVGVYALFDWCVGCDPQWLYDNDADRTLYSHDHGLYLPPVQTGTWTIEALILGVEVASTLTDVTAGLNPRAIEDVATALESVARDSLAAILNGIPKSWPVTDDELEALGWFLERRAKPAAARLRQLI